MMEKSPATRRCPDKPPTDAYPEGHAEDVTADGCQCESEIKVFPLGFAGDYGKGFLLFFDPQVDVSHFGHTILTPQFEQNLSLLENNCWPQSQTTFGCTTVSLPQTEQNFSLKLE